ncbi:hypothetical protein [Crossiella cryophila]|uniref:Uncharacterized protein n=1 Tax=Crossiella cryophila TaxID=43355 RepID=A0A7W7CHQ2_9PSEU|nr:hypothetical protein [Crossiella cryophila]MBB4681448.1 hypothetical protein [Crossiella cryophila]
MTAIAADRPLVTEPPAGTGGPGAARWRRLLVAIPVIVIAAEATALLAGLVRWRDALWLLLALEGPHIALIAGTMGYATVLTVRRRRGGMPGWTAFQSSYYQLLPAPVAWAITREFASLAAVLSLLLRGRRREARTFGYSAGRGRVFAIILLAILIELVLLHHVIPWPTVRLIHDIVGVYSLIIVIGYWAVPLTRPHRLLPDCLVLRSGHDVVAVVPWRGTVIIEHERLGIHPELDLAEERFVLPNGRGVTSLVIRSAEPVRARLGPRIGPVRVIHLGVDDPRAFRRAAAELGSIRDPEQSGP